MKRDLDLIRQILFKIEEHTDLSPITRLDIESHDQKEVNYHIMLLIDAGLVEGRVQKSGNTGEIASAVILHLTWQGHEFINASRNDTIWEKAKSIVREKAVGIPFSLLNNVLLELIKGQ